MTDEEIKNILNLTKLGWMLDSVRMEAIRHLFREIQSYERDRIIRICEDMIEESNAAAGKSPLSIKIDTNNIKEIAVNLAADIISRAVIRIKKIKI